MSFKMHLTYNNIHVGVAKVAGSAVKNDLCNAKSFMCKYQVISIPCIVNRSPK